MGQSADNRFENGQVVLFEVFFGSVSKVLALWLENATTVGWLVGRGPCRLEEFPEYNYFNYLVVSLQ